MTSSMYAYRNAAPPASRWAREARRAILAAIDGAAALERAAVIKAIDDAYPFGPRAHYPYKIWLKERRAALAALEQPDRPCAGCGAFLPPWATERCGDCERKDSR